MASEMRAEHEMALWAEHVPAMEAFLAIATQWNVVGRADGSMRVIGLDYGSVRSGLDLAGITLTPAQWADLQLIEQGAREAMNGGAR